MSFICDNCKTAVKPQEPDSRPRRRVVATREKSYVGGGLGWEIVKEQNLCRPCAGEAPKSDEKCP